MSTVLTIWVNVHKNYILAFSYTAISLPFWNWQKLACDFDLQIPVYKGCNKSLLGVPSLSDGFHGSDGMGDCEEDEKPGEDLLQKEHASIALINAAEKYPGISISKHIKVTKCYFRIE